MRGALDDCDCSKDYVVMWDLLAVNLVYFLVVDARRFFVVVRCFLCG